MKRFVTILALFSSMLASASDVNCPSCGIGGAPGYPPVGPQPSYPGSPIPGYPTFPLPGYPGSDVSPFPSYPYPSYPYPEYPAPSYPQPQPPSYPQPYPPSYPVPQPPRVCNTTTTCNTPCQWRPNAGEYQQICTSVNCRGEVLNYSARMCVPTDEPAPQPRPQPQPQQPTNPGQGGQQQKPGVQIVYEATASTVFKADPVASTQVSQERKCTVSPGSIIEGKILAVRADKLIKVVLSADIDGCYGFGKAGHVGFVYAPHMLER